MWAWRSIVGLLLLAALALRWPPPVWPHFDELAFVVIPLGFWGGDLNPHFFNYPTLQFYLCSAAYYLKYLATGTGSAEQFLIWRYFVQSTELIELARILQVGFSLASVWGAALLGRRLYGVGGGVCAGLLMVLAPINLRFAAVANTDGPAATWALWSVYLAVRARQDRRRQDLGWSGVLAGLAGATKYPAGLVVVGGLAAAMLEGPAGRRAGAARVLAGAALAFALASPFVWLDPWAFWRDLTQMSRDHLAGAQGQPAWALHLCNSLFYGVGGGALLGLGFTLARRPRAWRAEEGILLAAALALGGPLCLGSSAFMRYALPVVPLVVVLACRTLVALRPAGLRWGLAVLALCQPLYASVQTRQLLWGPDTRSQARQWLAGHFGDGAWVLGATDQCGSLDLFTPRQVAIRQTHFRRSYGTLGLRRAYAWLEKAPGMPALYTQVGGPPGEVVAPAGPGGGEPAAAIWSYHPVCGPETLVESGVWDGAVTWQGAFSPGTPEAARWDPKDWYFVPIAGFDAVQAAGPGIRVGSLVLTDRGPAPSAPQLFASLGQVLAGDEAFAAGDWRGAAQHYRQVAELPAPLADLLSAPVAQHLWGQLGRCEAALGRPEEAAAALGRAMAIPPAHPDLYHDLGLALAAAGRIGAAVQVWEQCLAAFPDYAPAHFTLGQALARSGRRNRARELWDRGAKLMPDHPLARQLRGGPAED